MRLQEPIIFSIGASSAVIGAYTNSNEWANQLPDTLLKITDFVTAILIVLATGNLFYRKNFLLGSLSVGFLGASLISRFTFESKEKTKILAATALLETIVFVAVKQSNTIMKKVSQLKLS